MDQESERRVKLSHAAGRTEAVKDALIALRAEYSVALRDEDFAEALGAEIEVITDRLERISADLTYTACSENAGEGFGDERYRLANCGLNPDPRADADQLAAIERSPRP